MNFIFNQQQYQVVIHLAGTLRAGANGAGKGPVSALPGDGEIRLAAAAEAWRVFTAACGECDIVHHVFAVADCDVVLSARCKPMPAGDAPAFRLVVEVEKALPGLTARTVLRARNANAPCATGPSESPARKLHSVRLAG